MLASAADAEARALRLVALHAHAAAAAEASGLDAKERGAADDCLAAAAGALLAAWRLEGRPPCLRRLLQVRRGALPACTLRSGRLHWRRRRSCVRLPCGSMLGQMLPSWGIRAGPRPAVRARVRRARSPPGGQGAAPARRRPDALRPRAQALAVVEAGQVARTVSAPLRLVAAALYGLLGAPAAAAAAMAGLHLKHIQADTVQGARPAGVPCWFASHWRAGCRQSAARRRTRSHGLGGPRLRRPARRPHAAAGAARGAVRGPASGGAGRGGRAAREPPARGGRHAAGRVPVGPLLQGARAAPRPARAPPGPCPTILSAGRLGAASAFQGSVRAAHSGSSSPLGEPAAPAQVVEFADFKERVDTSHAAAAAAAEAQAAALRRAGPRGLAAARVRPRAPARRRPSWAAAAHTASVGLPGIAACPLGSRRAWQVCHGRTRAVWRGAGGAGGGARAGAARAYALQRGPGRAPGVAAAGRRRAAPRRRGVVGRAVRRASRPGRRRAPLVGAAGRRRRLWRRSGRLAAQRGGRAAPARAPAGAAGRRVGCEPCRGCGRSDRCRLAC